jgi:protein required for attachment to host cells
MGTTDWHELEKERFAERVASAMQQLVRAEDVKAIVVVAPPRTLAKLRLTIHPSVKKRIIAEVEKDLTKHPVSDMEGNCLDEPGGSRQCRLWCSKGRETH